MMTSSSTSVVNINLGKNERLLHGFDLAAAQSDRMQVVFIAQASDGTLRVLDTLEIPCRPQTHWPSLRDILNTSPGNSRGTSPGNSRNTSPGNSRGVRHDP
ncbi:MAG: hypothetical protein KJ077_10595 [Anaerolineae bacterium]|nr:hypothetical protein [Anaerolineae bacterium]